MATGTWPECIAFTLQFEGGYDAHPSDRGNWTSGMVGKGVLKGTKYGIAAHVFPQLDIKNLTREQAIAIYRRDYWPKVAGDAQPAALDLVAWDICVNSGGGRALGIERQALGSNIATGAGLAALAASAPDKVLIVKRIRAARAAFYRGLSTFNVFGKGLAAKERRRGGKGCGHGACRREACPGRDQDATAGGAETAEATKSLTPAGSFTSGSSGAMATQATPAWALDWVTLGEFALVALLLAIAAYCIWKAVTHGERAKAYATSDELTAAARANPGARHQREHAGGGRRRPRRLALAQSLGLFGHPGMPAGLAARPARAVHRRLQGGHRLHQSHRLLSRLVQYAHRHPGLCGVERHARAHRGGDRRAAAERARRGGQGRGAEALRMRAQEHDGSDESRWHLDKRVPIALIFTIVMQTAGLVWWASSLTERVNTLERRADASAPQAERITRLEVNIEVVKDGIAEIKRLIRRESL
jgi:lysozyme family protein